MTIEIKELKFTEGYFVDVTDTELNAVKGGYTANVFADTGDLGKAAQAATIVIGKPVDNSLVITRQMRIGIPAATILKGEDLARNNGGRYSIGVTSAKLEG